jgi:hypothetical protein
MCEKQILVPNNSILYCSERYINRLGAAFVCTWENVSNLSLYHIVAVVEMALLP